MKTWTKTASIVISAIIVAGLFPGAVRADDIPVTFRGGHDIGKEDHGRPCVLIAAALGVKTEVFREALSGVTPAKNGKPSGTRRGRTRRL